MALVVLVVVMARAVDKMLGKVMVRAVAVT